jgi:hypothetical protein
VCWAREVVEEIARGLSNAAADAERQRDESERGHREQLEEFTLLQTRGSKLCFAIIGPIRMRNHLSEGMQIAALHHTEMVGEFATLQTTVSSVVEFTLWCSLDETFQVEVVDVLVTEFRELEEQRSRLERPGVWIYDLLLGPPSGRARLIDHLDEDAGQLGAELAARREADFELEALWTSVAQVRDLVLDRVDGMSFLAASLSIAAELLEGRVDATATNGVR